MQFKPFFNLSSLNGTNGFRIDGVAAGDYTGRSVSDAGDINGDGIDDLIIGVRNADVNGMSSGATYVVFGKNTSTAGAFSSTFKISDLDGSNGFRLVGAASRDYSGASVSSAGDINGDGIDDLIVGALGANPNGNDSGTTYVVFGGSGVGSSGSLNLSSLNGSDGFAINGIAARDNSGASISSAGDVNGDGINDLIIGAPNADQGDPEQGGDSYAGQSYVVFGGSGVGSSGSFNLSDLDGSNGFAINGIVTTINGNPDSANFGASVSGAGDINGDGFADLIIGAPSTDRAAGPAAQVGAAYVVFGGASVGSSGSLNASSLNGSNGFLINGAAAFDVAGYSVSNAGDINGDGIADLIIGAKTDLNGTNSGSAYVVFGKKTSVAGNFNSTLDLSTLNGSNGFRIDGFNSTEYAGTSVSAAGDINDDGIDDLIVGAFGSSPNGTYSGSAYVVFGKKTSVAGNFNSTLLLATLNGNNGFRLNGVQAGDNAGVSVSRSGDINGDGIKDLIIGAPNADPNAIDGAGSVYVVFKGIPNDPPTAIALSNTSVAENAIAANIGTFTTTDPDVGDIHTYTVDDPRFEVVGNQLKLKSDNSLDFETEPTIAVTVTTTDEGGLSFSQSFTISVGDNGNEAPVLLGSARTIKDIEASSNSANPANLTLINNTLYFTADNGTQGREVWRTNGNAASTVLLKDIAPGSSGSNPLNLTRVGNTVYFTANNSTNGTELWKSNGTLASTVLVKDISVGNGGSNPSNLVNLNGVLYFTATDSTNGTELWKSDGTEAGTTLVKDIKAGSGNAFPAKLIVVNSILYFTADDGTSGRELWKSDGTTAGTVMVTDIAPGSGGSFPFNLTDVNGTLYFTADNGLNGIELWKSDGTAAGTVLVKDIVAGNLGANPSNLTNVNGTLYFTADDGVNGIELWKSDGTAAGTVLVKDIAPGSDRSNPFNLTNVNGTLYFTANDGVNGEELWKSDGTAPGTVLVKDLLLGNLGSNPSNLTNVNGLLYFTADDGIKGRELWKSDGTLGGTGLVQDIVPGSGGSSPLNLANVNGTLYFTANDGTRGTELWSLGSGLANQTILQNTPLNPIFFSISDTESSATSLTVTAISSNPALVPNSNIDIVGSDSRRALTLTPLVGQSGATTITVNVSDGVNTTSTSFDLTVAATLLAIDATTLQQFEGQGSSTAFTFTVTRTGDTSGTSIVDYTVSGSSNKPATSADFGGTLPTGSVTFAPGETTQTITVNVSGDSTIELDEDFAVTLSNPINGALTTTTAIGRILDDDPAPRLAIAPLNANRLEGNNGTTSFTFQVTRTGNTRQVSTVDYAATGSSADPADANDFGGVLPTGTVTFAPGETTKIITVNVSTERDLEPDEAFTVTLSNPSSGTSITTATAIGNLTDDDNPRVTLSLSPIVMNETGGSATLEATIPKPFTQDVTINLGLFGGTAKRGVDYTVADTLVIPAGATSVTTPVSITSDSLVESDETFSIDIVSLINGLEAGGVQRVSGTIIDDDFTNVSISATTGSVKEDGADKLVFTITRADVTSAPLTVNYSVSGTAIGGTDYANIPNTVVIPAGKASATITIDPTLDKLAEANETAIVTLQSGTNYNLAGSTSATGTIQDDDVINVRIADVRIDEGTGGSKTAVVTVALSAPSTVPVTINYSTANGTATVKDYTSASGSLTIPGDGTTISGTIEIPITTDAIFEADETFSVNITETTSDATVKITQSTGKVTIANDDQKPTPPDPKDFKLDGNFGADGITSSNGTVYIGRNSGTQRLIRVEGGTVSKVNGGIEITDGTIYSEIGSISVPLFKGSTFIPFNTGVSSLFTDQNLGSDLRIAGLNPTFSGIFLDKNEIRLEGDLPLPGLLGGAGLSLSLGDNPTSTNALKITKNGIELGNDLPISNTSIKLFGMIPIDVPNFDLTYEKKDDLLKLQGELSLQPFSRVIGVPNFKVDLTNTNFIQIKNGDVDFVGELLLTNLKFTEHWGVDEASLKINTIDKLVGGEFGISFPFKNKKTSKTEGATIKLGADFYYDPLELNRIAGIIPLLPGVPIPKTGLKLVQLGGEVDHISPRDEDPIEFSGLVVLEDLSGKGLSIEGKVTVSEEKLGGEVTVTLIDADVLQGKVKTELNWNEAVFSLEGNVEALNGFLFGKSKLNVGNFGGSFGITSSGATGVRVPKMVKYIGGQELFSTNYYLSYVDNSNQSDDFAAAWRTINLLFTDVTVGAKINFNNPLDISLLGSAPVRPISSFEINPDADGTNRDWIILAAEWANRTSNVQVRIKTPDGTWIEESEFAAHGIVILDEFSDQDTRLVVVPNPDSGIWDIKVVDPTGLGAIEYSASESTIKPTINITSPAIDVLGGEVNIGFVANDADSAAEISFFYDTDNQGYDGFLLPGKVVESDGIGNYLWNTRGIAPGDYFIYAVIQDDVNQPIFSEYAQGSVKVVDVANLAVETTINDSLVTPGDTVTYTITVTNTEGSTAKDVMLLDLLPQEATLVSSSIPFVSVAGEDELRASLGDIDFGESVTVTLTVQTPAEVGTLFNVASVLTDTFDPYVTDDASVMVSIADFTKPEVPIVDLSVTATTDQAVPNPGEDFSLSFVVANNSQTKATGVTLTGNLAPSLSNLLASTGSIDANNILTVNLGDIEAGASKTVTVQAYAPQTMASIFNILDVRSNEDDFDLIDNLITQDIFFPSLALAIASTQVTESAGAIATTGTISRTGNTDTDLTVTLNSSDTTEVTVPITVVIPAGRESTTFAIAALEDVLVDGNQVTTITATAAGLSTATTTVTVTDTTPPSTVAIAVPDATAAEAGADPGTIRISRIGNTTAPLTVNYTVAGQATNGTDYTPTLTGVATIAAGSGFVDITITPVDDALVEGNESITLILADATTYDLGNGTTATVTIVDNDTTPPSQTPSQTLIGTDSANTLTGGEGNDNLLGLGGDDTLLGGGGNDALVGGSGADIVTGGAGADYFIFSGAMKAAALKQSLLRSRDHVTDFSVSEGDKFRLDFNNNLMTTNLPKGLFNAGRVQGLSLRSAAQAAYADKNQRKQGNQALRANEAVLFRFKGSTYLSVNNQTKGFNNTRDLLVDVTGIELAAGDVKAGILTVSNYLI